MEDQDPYIPVKKAAKMLGISTATIRQWCDKGIIEYLRLPTGVRRIKKSVIEKILVDGKKREENDDKRDKQEIA